MSRSRRRRVQGTWEVEAARSALVAAEGAVAREAAAEHALQHRLYESEGA